MYIQTSLFIYVYLVYKKMQFIDNPITVLNHINQFIFKKITVEDYKTFVNNLPDFAKELNILPFIELETKEIKVRGFYIAPNLASVSDNIDIIFSEFIKPDAFSEWVFINVPFSFKDTQYLKKELKFGKFSNFTSTFNLNEDDNITLLLKDKPSFDIPDFIPKAKTLYLVSLFTTYYIDQEPQYPLIIGDAIYNTDKYIVIDAHIYNSHFLKDPVKFVVPILRGVAFFELHDIVLNNIKTNVLNVMKKHLKENEQLILKENNINIGGQDIIYIDSNSNIIKDQNLFIENFDNIEPIKLSDDLSAQYKANYKIQTKILTSIFQKKII